MASDFQEYIKSLIDNAVVTITHTDGKTGETTVCEVPASELKAGRLPRKPKAGDAK